MRYNTVFLDMGFTLADVVPSVEAIVARAIHDIAGQDVSLPDLREATRQVWSRVLDDEPMVWEDPSEEADRQWVRAIDQRILAQVGITERHVAIADRAYDLFSQPDVYRVYDDVWPTLEALQARGYRLGIISNWGWHLPAICEHLGLAPYFDAILASARVGYEKPHPAFFHHALEALGADPARAVHVGDSHRTDVEGALGAGLSAVLLVRDARTVPEDPGCPVIHSLSELSGILERET